MKIRILLIAIVMLVTLLIGCNDESKRESTYIKEDETNRPVEEYGNREVLTFDEIENIFAFADKSGKRLITLTNENEAVFSNPEAIDMAIGNNGAVYDIKFVKQQKSNSMDNLRQNIYNFNNMGGYVFEVIGGELIPNKSYLLADDSKLNKDAFVKLMSTRDTESGTTSYKQVDIETIKMIEKIKDRKIKKSSLISETVDNAKVCLFVFERREDDMLASIAYINGEKVIFKDYPAKYDELSTWRVDAGDEPGLFEVLFIANSDQGLLLGLTWAAPEGENIFVLKETHGGLEETSLTAGRYWAP